MNLVANKTKVICNGIPCIYRNTIRSDSKVDRYNTHRVQLFGDGPVLTTFQNTMTLISEEEYQDLTSKFTLESSPKTLFDTDKEIKNDSWINLTEVFEELLSNVWLDDDTEENIEQDFQVTTFIDDYDAEGDYGYAVKLLYYKRQPLAVLQYSDADLTYKYVVDKDLYIRILKILFHKFIIQNLTKFNLEFVDLNDSRTEYLNFAGHINALPVKPEKE